VRIDLPVEGIAHYFKRTVVPQGKALELSLYTYNSGLRQVTRLALVGLGFFIGLTVGRLIFLRLVERRVAVRLVAAAIAGAALLVILRAAFDPEVGLAYMGIAVGIIATLLPWFITRMAERPRAPKVRPEVQQEGA
jgi:hypothetical protein